jgi:putative flippase GtrA
VATAADFAWMVFAVERLGIPPAMAAATGAALGAVANFLLGRTWVFRRPSRGAWTAQAVRYALVASASAILNGLGEHVLHDLCGVGYLSARVAVSLAVGILWNYPLQRVFVFQAGRA